MHYVPQEPPALIAPADASVVIADTFVRGQRPIVEWQTTSASLQRVAEPVMRVLARAFFFRCFENVERVVEESPQLVPLLVEAHERARAIFGTEVPLILDVVTNPDSICGDSELFLFIQTALEPSRARELLERLDETWWLDALPAAENRLSIALEYV